MLTSKPLKPSKIINLKSSPKSKPDAFFSPESLVADLKAESAALGLPELSLDSIIARVLKAVLTWLETRDIITKSDLERVVVRELEKYSADLAFAYENREKFI